MKHTPSRSAGAEVEIQEIIEYFNSQPAQEMFAYSFYEITGNALHENAIRLFSEKEKDKNNNDDKIEKPRIDYLSEDEGNERKLKRILWKFFDDTVKERLENRASKKWGLESDGDNRFPRYWKSVSPDLIQKLV